MLLELEHHVLSFEEWKRNSAPTLLESACFSFLQNLERFCEVRMGILSLRPCIQIPLRASDILLEKCIQMRYIIDLPHFSELKRNAEADDDIIMGVFFNQDPKNPQTRLTKARLENLNLTAELISLIIRSHPTLEELNINVSDSTSIIIETINEHARNLKKLNIQHFGTFTVYGMHSYILTNSLIPSDESSDRCRFAINWPNLRSLGIKHCDYLKSAPLLSK